jgi:hypothetical protein
MTVEGQHSDAEIDVASATQDLLGLLAEYQPAASVISGLLTEADGISRMRIRRAFDIEHRGAVSDSDHHDVAFDIDGIGLAMDRALGHIEKSTWVSFDDCFAFSAGFHSQSA